MRAPPLITGEYYHVFDRGVSRETIFLDEFDYRRFYESLFLFNNTNYEHPGGRGLDRDVLLAAHEAYLHDRDPYVKISSFCLIPNHFHLMIQPLKEDGAAKFFHKLLKGYARYFNLRHGRSGHLFENAYQAVHIENEAHFVHIPRYIHLNALDTTDLNWRDGQMTDWAKASNYLESYRWSSHGIYSGKDQELPVIDEEIVAQLFSDPSEYEKFLKDWSGRYILKVPVTE